MKRVLLTGCAGFIGFHVTQRLLQSGHEVIGIDNLNRFYNEGLKPARLEILKKDAEFQVYSCRHCRPPRDYRNF